MTCIEFKNTTPGDEEYDTSVRVLTELVAGHYRVCGRALSASIEWEGNCKDEKWWMISANLQCSYCQLFTMMTLIVERGTYLTSDLAEIDATHVQWPAIQSQADDSPSPADRSLTVSGRAIGRVLAFCDHGPKR